MKLLRHMNSRVIGIILGLFIALSVCIGWLLYSTNPKIKFIHLINKEYESLMTILDQIENSDLVRLSKDNTITSVGNASFNISLSNNILGAATEGITDAINNSKLEFQYGFDKKNSNSFLKLNSSIATKDFIAIEMYQTKNKSYLYLNEIFNKYIESNNNITNSSNQTIDTKYLTDKIKISLLKAIKASDFKMQNKTIMVNSDKIRTNKLTFKLNDKRLKEIVVVVLTDLRNDNKCLNILNNLSNRKEAKVLIDRNIKSLTNMKLLKDPMAIDIYTKNDNIVKLDVFNKTSKIIEYINFNNFYPTKAITIFRHDRVIFDASFELKSSNAITYRLSLGDDQIIANGDLMKTVMVSSTGKSWDTSLSFDLILSYGNSVLGSLKIDTNTATEIGEKVDLPIFSKTIEKENLTDQEKEQIEKSFRNKIEKTLPISLPTLNLPKSAIY